MKFIISTFNFNQKVKNVRYVVRPEQVAILQQKLMKEVSEEAFTIVLTEITE